MNPSLTQLLEKYNVPGPRYTSYPTVPVWQDKVGVQDYQSSLQALNRGEKLSLYFHLPFCEKLCHFCGCMRVITKNHDRSQQYVQSLLKEIDHVVNLLPQNSRTVSQIHFGGGTPNFLKPQELAQIINKIHQCFNVETEAEIAIEMHPRTSTQKFCDQLKVLQFNRISLGVQDFDPQVQKLINRHQSYEQTVEMVTYLRELGFTSFNFDLIYGLPGQTLSAWKNTLQKVVELKPNRLAVYSYAHVPWVQPVQRSFKDEDLPLPELKLQLFEAAYQVFLAQGYRSIGMDHFALAEDELSQALKNGSLHRNFMGYSTRADAHQLGFGVSAISYVSGNYFQNLKQISEYEQSISQERLATYRGYLLSQEDSLRRDLISQIMCLGRVNLTKFQEHWGIQFKSYFEQELKQLKPLEKDKLVSIQKDMLLASETGQLFLRIIAMVFDQYLGQVQSGAQNPVFSKTV